MKLSPLAHAHLRKLLDQDNETFELSDFKASKHPTPNGAQNSSSASDDLPAATIRELEILVQLHQRLETESGLHTEKIAEIERRLARLVGTMPLYSRASPFATVTEQTCKSFRFYQQDSLHEGILYGNELYGLVKQFQIQMRQQSKQFAHEIAARQVAIVLTHSANRWAVWVSLRSPACSNLLNTGLVARLSSRLQSRDLSKSSSTEALPIEILQQAIALAPHPTGDQ